MYRLPLFAWLLLAVCAPLRAADPPAAENKEKPAPSRDELEKQFAAEMSGATLVGHYSLGKQPAGKEERYELSEVTKIEGDRWLFKSRIVYGNHDVTVPMYLEVKWAGDTPVITLTDLAIPGLGTYTARVLIYRGQYAGTWSGGDHGGALYGHVEKKKPADVEGDAKSTPKP